MLPENLKKKFSQCKSQQEIYQKIVALGKKLLPFPNEWKVEENLVSGCQSIMYLHSYHRDGKMFFSAFSDALISSGLAAILIEAYNEREPDFVINNGPKFLQEFKIISSLSPGRANGVANLYLKMQKEALKALTNKKI